MPPALCLGSAPRTPCLAAAGSPQAGAHCAKGRQPSPRWGGTGQERCSPATHTSVTGAWGHPRGRVTPPGLLRWGECWNTRDQHAARAGDTGGSQPSAVCASSLPLAPFSLHVSEERAALCTPSTQCGEISCQGTERRLRPPPRAKRAEERPRGAAQRTVTQCRARSLSYGPRRAAAARSVT